MFCLTVTIKMFDLLQQTSMPHQELHSAFTFYQYLLKNK